MARGEVEIVVLGSRTGESVVLRLGADTWVIVDSFKGRFRRSKHRVAPLAYLDTRGVDVDKHVRAVVLTHLHADHCHGIDDVVTACSSAQFYMPAAVPDDQWEKVLASLHKGAEGSAKAKLRGIATAYNVARERRKFKPVGATDRLALGSHELYALGPSAEAQTAARDACRTGTHDAAYAIARENYTSVVLWLRLDGSAALLGADMDCHDAVGWSAILREHDGETWIRDADFVKVPHHGSYSAHDPAVYRAWTSAAVGVVTPMARHGLPGDEMITVLKDAFPGGLWLAGALNRRNANGHEKKGAPVHAVRAVWVPKSSRRWRMSPRKLRL